MNTKHLLLGALFLIVLAGCGGLSSEPEILREVPLPTPAPQVTAPEVAPNLTNGAAFYAEHCAMCHGVYGQGDGEMVRDGRLQSPPPDLTDPAIARDRTPLAYMRLITDGNMMAGMPPFARYSAQERWDVTAFVYTGAYAAEQIALGELVYARSCQSCHGESGAGDGPDAPEIMPDLSDINFWAETSTDVVVRVISQGAGTLMAGFADDLSPEEIEAVAGYLRMFAMTGQPGFDAPAAEAVAEAPAPVATEEVAESAGAAAVEEAPAATEAVAERDEPAEVEVPTSLTVTGVVTNRSADGTIPAGASITLHMFDMPDFEETTLETQIAEDGSYTFERAEYVSGRAYILSMSHEDVFFSSAVYTLDNAEDGVLNTSVEIFESTSDPSVLYISTGVMHVTFTNFGLDVTEIIQVTNTSDRIFLTDEAISENQYVALRIPLPPGAGGIGFEPGMEGTRFFISEEGTEVIDVQPVRPGQSELAVSFFIPYEDGAIIEQELNYAVQGPFHLLIQAGQLALESDMFDQNGERVDMGGQAFDAYVANLEAPAGSVISYTLSGELALAGASPAAESSGQGLSPLVIGLIVAGVLLIGVGGFLFLLRQDAGVDDHQQAIDDLLEQIADLDDQHDQGAINHDVYQRTRAELKAELTELMAAQAAGIAGTSPEDSSE